MRKLRGFIIRMPNGRYLGKGSKLVAKKADALRLPSEGAAQTCWEIHAKCYHAGHVEITIEFMDETIA